MPKSPKQENGIMKIESLLAVVILLAVIASGILLWRVNRLELMLGAKAETGTQAVLELPAPGSQTPATTPPPDDPIPSGSR
jgi:hypothetical protein